MSISKNESNMNNTNNNIFKDTYSQKLFSYDSIEDISYVKNLVLVNSPPKEVVSLPNSSIKIYQFLCLTCAKWFKYHFNQIY
jgi:hypothetical protein